LVTIAFDDGTENEYTYAFPLMRDRGIRGTFYIVTDVIDTQYFMSLAELQTLQANGNEIGSHSKTHRHFTELSDSEIQEECLTSRTVLQSYGFPAVNFAYPYGDMDERTDAIVDDYYASGRSAWGDTWTMPLPVNEFVITGTAGDAYQEGVLAYLKQIVDLAYNNNEWTIIYFHNVTPEGGEEYTVNTQDFEGLLDYIVSLGMPTATVGEVLGNVVSPYSSTEIFSGFTSYPNNPVITTGADGAWNERIYEIGNAP
jgi:peptidoglycan/xylan/chitin deacetylase (PgdA/CDA1 family)